MEGSVRKNAFTLFYFVCAKARRWVAKMRVLWLCNICPPAVAVALGREYSVREGWITGALNRYLGADKAENAEGKMELGICFPADGELTGFGEETFVRALTGREDGPGRTLHLYGFGEDLRRPEKYEPALEERFAAILSDFKPDLVHIFGTEFPHALAMARSFGRPERILVSLQGMMGACADSYMADLPEWVQRRKTLRDVLRQDGLKQQQEKFRMRAEREKELLSSCRHVAGRTAFDRKESLRLNPGLRYHTLNETMRACFYEGKWKRERCKSWEIFISQGDYPLKGFHYLLEAMGPVLKEYPQACIKVAGNSILRHGTLKEKLKLSGYGKYLLERIRENGLDGKVTVLGSLSDVQMKEAYLQSHIFVCPSSLENSPNSLGEAMLLGVPCVASRTGGIPDMAEDGESALLFTKGKAEELAECILRIFRSDELAEHLSLQAARRARKNHDADANYAKLLSIYGEIMSGENGREAEGRAKA